MKPALSVVAFTALAGAAQGLVVLLAGAAWAGPQAVPLSRGFTVAALALALAMLAAALAASFLHLGRPERAWRAAAMWRTSWLSREVIALPAFGAAVAAWAAALHLDLGGAALQRWALPATAMALAAALWGCTAMIYACLRFIQEWAHPLTPATYVLTGLSAGSVLGAALAAAAGEAGLLALAGPTALACTVAAGVARWAVLRRNARLKPRSTLQSATGIPAQRLVQTSMGMTGGSFNTREFFHGATRAAMARARVAALALGFAVPAALLAAAAWAAPAGAAWPWIAAALVQAPGLLVERWVFFAQARHPQNLYYQVVG